VPRLPAPAPSRGRHAGLDVVVPFREEKRRSGFLVIAAGREDDTLWHELARLLADAEDPVGVAGSNEEGRFDDVPSSRLGGGTVRLGVGVDDAHALEYGLLGRDSLV